MQTNGMLSQTDWEFVQRAVPIVCVDLLIHRTQPASQAQIGLILRETPHQGMRWCLVGGRLLLNEDLACAVNRQVLETLGPEVTLTPGSPKFLGLFEYLRVKKPGRLHDPRKHVISLVYAINIAGTMRPQGEAINFQWFDVSSSIDVDEIGFDQASVIERCCQQLFPAHS